MISGPRKMCQHDIITVARGNGKRNVKKNKKYRSRGKNYVKRCGRTSWSDGIFAQTVAAEYEIRYIHSRFGIQMRRRRRREDNIVVQAKNENKKKNNVKYDVR